MIENCTPVVVTRGNVALGPVLDPLRETFGPEPVVWNNGADGFHDVAVMGRYLGTFLANTSLIYVQDDDCVVPDPSAVYEAYEGQGSIVCNMPREFRHDGYTDSALVGFGAVFHRLDALGALARFSSRWIGDITLEWLYRVCDVPVTVLLERTLVDVERRNLEYAYGEDRMYRQETHIGERYLALDLAREVRDA